MALIETWLNSDLGNPVQVKYLNGNLFSQDNQANLIGVRVYESGDPASLAGSVSANVIRADGSTVAVAGTLQNNNECYVILPQTAYAVSGAISVIIKLTSGSQVTTLAAVISTVYTSSTDTVVDPGTIIPDIQALIAEIETAIASIPADYTSLWTSLAPAFNPSKSGGYKAGEYVTYNGGVYKFKNDHSGSWSSSDVDAVDIGSELTKLQQADSELKSAFDSIVEPNINLFDVHQFVGASGITVNNGEVVGTPNYLSNYGGLQIVGGYKANTQYTIQMQAHIASSASSTGLTVTAYYTDSTSERLYSWARSQTSYLYKCATTASGKTVSGILFGYSSGKNDTWYIKNIQIEEGTICTEYSSRVYSAIDDYARSRGNVLLPTGEDQTDEIYYRLFNYGCCNLDKGEYIVDNLIMPQGAVLYGSGDSSVIKLSSASHEFTLEQPVSSAEGIGYIGIYNGPGLPKGLYTVIANVATEYTGTTTSRVVFLNSDTYSSANVIKTVNIGRGEDKTFTTFIGETIKGIYILSGHATGTEVSITVSKFEMEIESTAIIMQSGCSVENVSFVGADTSIELTGIIGKRHAIGWFIPANQYGIINRCRISEFDGSAILLQDTSTPVDHSVLISDCHLFHNMVGIYIRRNSEFNKIVNCGVTRNYYGCLNRGGNNIISNCGFDSNVIGMQIDADEGDNQGHGSISNCTFNHSNNNEGYGLIVKGTGRELIGNCQFWYSNIRLQNTNGNVINGCEFGNSAVIEITNTASGTTKCNLITGCMMRTTDNTITIYNDQKSKVVNCWTRDGVEMTPTYSDEPI